MQKKEELQIQLDLDYKTNEQFTKNLIVNLLFSTSSKFNQKLI